MNILSEYRKIKRLKNIKDLIRKGDIGLGHSITDTRKALRFNLSAECIRLYKDDSNGYLSYINEIERWLVRYKLDQGYQNLFDNKILFTECFSQFVDIPKIVLTIQGGRAFSSNGAPIKKLEMKDGEYIVKPINESRSIGVHLLSKSNDRYSFDGIALNSAELFNKLKSLKNALVCERIINSNYASNIAPNSTNTIRIITFCDDVMESPKIAAAMHRFGNQGIVDGAVSGGVFAKIDLETGVLSKALSHRLNGFFSHHPVFNTQIEGVQVPFWKEIKSKVLAVHSLFRFVQIIGWDICVGHYPEQEEDKIYAIEANASSDLDWIQAFGGLAYTDFGQFLFRNGCKYGR